MSHQQQTSSCASVAYTMVDQCDSEEIPPAYEAASASQKEFVEKKLPEKLPSYELATNLPSYNDLQEIKEDEARQELLDMFFGISMDTDEVYVDGVAVGTDCMFIFAFILSFFFNWLGFFIGYCILLNLAGRYGAISGFGLSIINWLLYLKYSDEGEKYMTEERLLLWWFFLVFAILLTLKGIVNWAKARRLLELTPEQRQNGRVVVLY